MRAALLIAALTLVSQPTTTQQGPYPGSADPYEQAALVPLEDLATGGGVMAYVGRRVRTRGTFHDVYWPPYYRLTDGQERLLLIWGGGASSLDTVAASGLFVEVVGVFGKTPTSVLAEHPAWPRYCVRASGPLADFTPFERKRRPAASTLEGLALGDDLPDDIVTVVGQYRGRNLFGDLPAGSQVRKDDWVIRHGVASAWVTGKKTRGKGWSLDLDAKSDCRLWILVRGRPERRDGVLRIHAKHVSLTALPT